ncbi:hypothetical protein ACSBR2_012443 [Camellia fascicularis]
MEKEQKETSEPEKNHGGAADNEDNETIELVLFQVPECYVYLIPPRKSAASYRADEWNVNKWAWEGMLKVVSKGEECIIRLEDKTTGELYARAFLRDGEPHPVEPVIDSSRYLNKKKTAEEMEQQYQKSSSVDYSLKDGETLVLQLKNNSGRSVRSKFFEQGLNNLSLEEKGNPKVSAICIKPLPPPPAPLSPVVGAAKSPSDPPSSLSLEGTPDDKGSASLTEQSKETHSRQNQSAHDIPDDDFGDFQTAV